MLAGSQRAVGRTVLLLLPLPRGLAVSDLLPCPPVCVWSLCNVLMPCCAGYARGIQVFDWGCGESGRRRSWLCFQLRQVPLPLSFATAHLPAWEIPCARLCASVCHIPYGTWVHWRAAYHVEISRASLCRPRCACFFCVTCLVPVACQVQCPLPSFLLLTRTKGLHPLYIRFLR